MKTGIGTAPGNVNRSKTVFRALHILWAIVAMSVIAILAMSSKGHPPGIVFVPVVLVIWITGHVFLWLSHLLVKRGQTHAENEEGALDKWPLALALIALIFGGTFIFGVITFGVTSLIGSNSPRSLLLTVLLPWLPTSICFIGILLRQSWSRFATSGLFFAAALFLLYQMMQSLGYPPEYHSTTEWIGTTLVVFLLVGLGWHFFRSQKIRAFLSR